MSPTPRRIIACLLAGGLLIASAAQASRAPTASESNAVARAALKTLPGTGWHVGHIRVSTVKSSYKYAKAAVDNSRRGVTGEMLLRFRNGHWGEVFLRTGGFCSVAAPSAVLKDLHFGCEAKPNVRLRATPRTIPPGGHITLTGSGFHSSASVWIGVGPPQSEATRIGSARTDATGAFRKTFTISRQPGRYVAIACQRQCRVKASATFRVVGGRG